MHKSDMKKINEIIKIVRSGLSDIAFDHDKNDEDLYRFIGVKNSRSYGFVIDALYLLEDTQLAKQSFIEKNLSDFDFGTLYLLIYGVLNACYMQQQAILMVCREMGIVDKLDEIKSAEVIKFRNSFSAHTSNRGSGANEHSFILDRHAMRSGLVEGYSANHEDGFFMMRGDVYDLIAGWDGLFLSQLEIVYAKVYPNS